MATRYIVHGIDEVTGTPAKKLVEAESSAQAEAIAAKIGLRVLGSEIDLGQATAAPAPSAARGGPQENVAETVAWEGTPSLWNLFWLYVSCLLIIPIPWAIYHHLRIKKTLYTITNQRLRITTGIISRDIEEIELYRVLDSAVEQSAMDRMLGIGTVTINSSDERQPLVKLERIPAPREVREQLRQLSEARRRWRKVQEIEVQ